MLTKEKDLTQDHFFNLWFIKLRWIACTIAFVLVYLAVKIFHYLSDKNFWILLALISILGLSNLLYYSLIKNDRYIKYLKEIQIGFDLIILTLLLQFSGGLENPLSFLYIIHIILSGILLSKRKSYITVIIAFSLYSILAFGELTRILPHYTFEIFPHEVENKIEDQPKGPLKGQHTEEEIHTALYAPYVISMSALNLFMMLLTAYFTTNIMEKLRYEEHKTKIERQRLEKVLKATNTGLIIIDKNFKIIWYNKPLICLLDLTDINSSQIEIILNKWINFPDNILTKTLKDGINRSVEREYFDKSGQKQYFQVTIAPLFDDEGEIYQAVELIQDITKKKLLEAEMIHSAKMVTLGTMAAGIAHEVGNPLASISTRLKLLEDISDPDFISNSISLLKREIARIDRIVRGISQFGRTKNEEWNICDINKILSETLEILKYHKVSKLCRIEYSIVNNFPTTFGVADQLKQVFLNIGLNALEAMPAGGKLKISTNINHGFLVILFSDSGIGINEQYLTKIFQPFFTTKETGSGLGLYIVNHIIEAHGGQLKISSKINEGTKFTILLPIYKK